MSFCKTSLTRCEWSVTFLDLFATILLLRGTDRPPQAEEKLPARSQDFSEWYNELVLKAQLLTTEGTESLLLQLATPQLLGQNLGLLNRQFGSFPSYDAAGNFSDAIKSAALQQARGDRRPVPARTIDQQGAVLWQLFQLFR
jgi:hypothetical protein